MYSDTAPRRAARLLIARRAGTRWARRPAARASMLVSYRRAISFAVELLTSTWQPRPASSMIACCKPLLIGAGELRCGIRREVRRRAQRRVRRIDVQEIAAFGERERPIRTSRTAGSRAGSPARRRPAAGLARSADRRPFVASRRDVERAARVHAKQPVEAGAIQVDEHRGQLRRVRNAALRASAAARAAD